MPATTGRRSSAQKMPTSIIAVTSELWPEIRQNTTAGENTSAAASAGPPIIAATTTIDSAIMQAWLSRTRMDGSASGSSTQNKRCAGVAPNASAATATR